MCDKKLDALKKELQCEQKERAACEKENNKLKRDLDGLRRELAMCDKQVGRTCERGRMTDD